MQSQNAGPGTGSPEAAAWNAWFQRLGDNLQDRGNPVFKQRSVGHCGTDTVLGGYTLLTADNLDAALQLAEARPALKAGGGIEVGELTLLNRARVSLAQQRAAGRLRDERPRAGRSAAADDVAQSLALV